MELKWTQVGSLDERFVESTERCSIYVTESTDGTCEYRTEYKGTTYTKSFYDSSLEDARCTAREMDIAYKEASSRI